MSATKRKFEDGKKPKKKKQKKKQKKAPKIEQPIEQAEKKEKKSEEPTEKEPEISTEKEPELSSESEGSEGEDEKEDLVPFTHLPGEKITPASEKPEIVNLDFDYFDMRDSDYHALKNFLNSFLNDDKFDSSDLSTIIIEQLAVGTTIKNGGGETDPLAFLTAVNLYQHKDRKCVKQIKEFLIENCKQVEMKSQLQKLLDPESNQKIGLLIQDRLKNVAPELIPPLHKAFMEDVGWAVENESKAWQPYFDFEYFILISNCAAIPSRTTSMGIPKIEKKKIKKKKGKKENQQEASTSSVSLSIEDSVFYKFDEQFYFQEALFWYGFVSSGLSQKNYVVTIIPKNKLENIVQNIETCVQTAVVQATLSSALPPQ